MLNRDWPVIILAFVILGLFSGLMYFHEFLKKAHYDSIPLTEVTWTYQKREPLLWTLTDNCPKEELKAWLLCRDKIRSDMYRRDL